MILCYFKVGSRVPPSKHYSKNGFVYRIRVLKWVWERGKEIEATIGTLNWSCGTCTSLSRRPMPEGDLGAALALGQPANPTPLGYAQNTSGLLSIMLDLDG